METTPTHTPIPAWRKVRTQNPSAQDILETCALRRAPIDVFAIAERLDIHVHLVSDPGWDGALKSSPERADVWIDANASEQRQRFTLAHEIGHLMLHPLGEVFRDSRELERSPKEREAHRFAAELLMPEVLVLPAFRRLDQDVEKMALLFHVSEQAMSIRLGVLFGALSGYEE